VKRLFCALAGFALAASIGAANLGARPAQAADSPSAAASAAPIIVHTKDFAYAPPTLTIPVGTKVTFVNDDDPAHTITAVVKTADGKPIFDSGNMDKGGKWTHTFNTAGTFAYFCAYHTFMKAKIVVTPAP
jgi:plastocyanin